MVNKLLHQLLLLPRLLKPLLLPLPHQLLQLLLPLLLLSLQRNKLSKLDKKPTQVGFFILCIFLRIK